MPIITSCRVRPVASCLLTFRNGDPQRTRNLFYVIKLLAAIVDLEIVVVEQGNEPSFGQSPLPDMCRYVFAFNNRSFNKSWGLNIAASVAKSDVFIVHDADIIIDSQVLRNAIKDVTCRYDVIKPYDNLIDLTRRETKHLISGGTALTVTRFASQLNRVDQQEHPPVCGGVFLISRTCYFAVGGMDERFSGWGGEDDAMSHRILCHSDKLQRVTDSTAYHLWHEKQTDSETDPQTYIANLALLTAYTEMGEPLVTGLAGDQNTIGDRKKYTIAQHDGNSKSPLISCLCVTCDRVDKLRRAIRCFSNQTYASTELVIVCESHDERTIEYLNTINESNISIHTVESSPRRSLGELRNIALDAAHGEYFCQWDDDDYYHPDRLLKQLAFVRQHRKAASILPRWLIYSEPRRQGYLSNIRLWEGSILCRRDILDPGPVYHPVSRGEETALLRALIIKDEIAIVDCPELYVYCHSGRNTWSDDHFDRMFSLSTPLPREQSDRLSRLLEPSLTMSPNG